MIIKVVGFQGSLQLIRLTHFYMFSFFNVCGNRDIIPYVNFNFIHYDKLLFYVSSQLQVDLIRTTARSSKRENDVQKTKKIKSMYKQQFLLSNKRFLSFFGKVGKTESCVEQLEQDKTPYLFNNIGCWKHRLFVSDINCLLYTSRCV